MKNCFGILIGTFFLLSCGNKTPNATTVNVPVNDTLILLAKIHSTDSLLFIAYNNPEKLKNSKPPIVEEMPVMNSEPPKDILTDLLNQAIELNMEFANKYSKHSYAPEALDKVHQLYMQLGNYHFSTEYGMMLIEKYPDYKRINPVIYSVATSYDFMLNNPDKAVLLYKELLQKNISDNTRNEINARLKILGH